MSAWYVLSSMGIYAVTPGQNTWSTTKPFFEKSIVNFENKSSKIITSKTSEFELRTFDAYTEEDDLPPVEADINGYNLKSFFNSDPIIPVPAIQAESKSFKDKLVISITTQNPNDKIYCDIVSLENKKAYFEEVKGKKISDSEVRAAIKKAGYEAVKIYRK
jgi:hypothetical protein